MNEYTTIKIPVKIAGLIRNLVDAFNFHTSREIQLADLAYNLYYKEGNEFKPVTGEFLGEKLGITKSTISFQYPKGDNR